MQAESPVGVPQIPGLPVELVDPIPPDDPSVWVYPGSSGLCAEPGPAPLQVGTLLPKVASNLTIAPQAGDEPMLGPVDPALVISPPF